MPSKQKDTKISCEMYLKLVANIPDDVTNFLSFVILINFWKTFQTNVDKENWTMTCSISIPIRKIILAK